MSGQPAASGAGGPRVLVVGAGETYDVFEVVDDADGVIRVRSPFLFEIGEEIALRVERGGTSVDVRARVRAHVDGNGGKITELELAERGEPREGGAS